MAARQLMRMMRHGGLQLKRYRFGVCAAAAFALCSLFCGCRTAPPPPEQAVVDAVDLLDGKSAFYLKIPASLDPTLLRRMLSGSFKSLSDEDARMIVSRVDTLYAGLTRKASSSEFQLAASCAVPKAAVPYVFSAKNGWKTRRTTPITADQPVWNIYNNGSLDVALPSERIVCAGRAAPEMLRAYHALSRAEPPYAAAYGASDALSIPVREWLTDGGDEIRFFAVSPQSFLASLTGTNLNYKLAYARGKMAAIPNDSVQYVMEFEFEFRDKSIVLAAKAALSLAFGLTDSEAILETPTHLKLRGIKIDREYVYKVLVL